MYMIGRKVSSKANANSNIDGAIVSSGSSTPPPRSAAFGSGPAAPIASAGAKPSRSKKPLLAVAAVLAIVAIGASVYFLVIKKPAGSSSNAVKVTEGVSASGPNASANIQKQLDDKIAKSADADEVIDAKFSKVSFMIMDEDYETALTTLDEFIASDLSDYNQYRLYNYYTTVHKYLGNGAEADRYQKLSDEAHERDLASYKPEAQ